MSKILLIGGSGFVGSFLIRELDGFKIQNLDKRQSPFYNEITTLCDITKINQINFSKEIDTVILLAAEHKDDVSPVSKYYDVNVQGTKNVLVKMDEFEIKNFIFISSVAVYGLNKSNPNELHVPDPFNHYAKSKLKAEQAVKEWFDKNSKNKSVTIIRPTVIFGERNRGNVYNLLKQISSRKFLMIGNGQNKKSMAYVRNVVAFIKNRIEEKEQGYCIFNYADKPDFSTSELVSVIEKKMKFKIPKFKIPYFIGYSVGLFFDLIALVINKKLSISSVRVKKFCATTQIDSAKAFNIFEPPFSMEQALNKTLDYEFVNSKKISDGNQ